MFEGILYMDEGTAKYKRISVIGPLSKICWRFHDVKKREKTKKTSSSPPKEATMIFLRKFLLQTILL